MADFGLARFLDAVDGQTSTGEVLGTPEFMAPEQALGRTDLVGPATDVHALGAVLYEVLTGRPPFAGPTRKDIMRQVTAAAPIPPDRLQPDVPADLAAICLKCLEKDGRHRYPSAVALRDDLDRFLAGRGVSARPRSWPGWLRDRVRRHPLRSLAVFGVVMVPVGMMAGAAWAWRAAREEQRSLHTEAEVLRGRYAAAAADLYAVRIRLANEAIVDGKMDEAKALLDAGKPVPGEPDPRGWEWNYLQNRLRGAAQMRLKEADAHGRGFPPPPHAAETTSRDGRRKVTIAPDGRLIVSDATGRVLLWLPVPGNVKAVGVHFSADGHWLAVRTADDDLVVYDGEPGGLAGEWSVPVRSERGTEVPRGTASAGARYGVGFVPSPFDGGREPESHFPSV